ncbi:MAG: hypothetical protein GX817_00155 [Elusimicrobia bacterium]|nr:hypothetical protein [Elusimicrobiota bacterium]
MKDFKNIIGFLGLIIIFIISGCAKTPLDTIHIPKLEDDALVENLPRSEKLFGIFLLDFNEEKNSDEDLYRNILSGWRDLIDGVSESGMPLVLATSNSFIGKFSLLEKDTISFGDIIEENPTNLPDEDLEYLDEKYSLNESSRTVVYGQIQEVLSWLGESLKEEEIVIDILVREEPGISEKERLISFLKDEIIGFKKYLKFALGQANIRRAAVSLSDAYLQLISPERVRTQVLEGLLSYKNFIGEFPEGFIPRGGYLDSSSIPLIESTSLSWVVALSSTTLEEKTNPLLMPYSNPDSLDAAQVLITSDPRYFTGGLPKAEFVNLEKYIESQSYISTSTVQISDSSFEPKDMPIKPTFESIKRYLSEANAAIQEYRNSGRASVRVLNTALRHLASAESGRFADEPEYEQKFRFELISLYRAIGDQPPLYLFLHLSGHAGQIIPEKQITGILDVETDGIISFREWDKGAYHTLNSSFSVNWGYDGSNFYAGLISTKPVSNVRLLLGHMDSAAAALYRRGTNENPVGFPVFIEAYWNLRSPNLLGVYRTTGGENWERITHLTTAGYSEGVLEMALPLRYLNLSPERNIFMKFIIDDEVFPETGIFEVPSPEVVRTSGIIAQIDPAGDNNGPGNYNIPEEYSDSKGNFDFRGIDVYERGGDKVISLEFSSLQNPLEAPFGFSPQIIDVYIDVNGRIGLGSTALLEGRRAYTVPEDAWEYAVSISGWEKGIYNAAGQLLGEPDISVNSFSRTINIFISDSIIPAPVENWGVIPILIPGDEKGKLTNIMPIDSGEEYYTGRSAASDPNIFDLILPTGHSQTRILRAGRRGGSVEIPALRVR